MFIGIDEVDWASMEHAYGSAADVPMLLRGLLSELPDERERALDGMYGAVHHQGDVYDSTLACIPFLFDVVGQAGLPDRGSVVELLASIGGTDLEDEDFPDDPDADRPDNYVMARAAVRAGAEVFFGLTEDADPEVRRAAAHAVVRFADGPARVFTVLHRRVEREADDSVKTALIEALGCFARLHPASPLPAVDPARFVRDTDRPGTATGRTGPTGRPRSRTAAEGPGADGRRTAAGEIPSGTRPPPGRTTARRPTRSSAGCGGCVRRTRRAPGCCARCTPRSAAAPPSGSPC
ncbi:HEAT repeat domain-containing protein [Streptomyces sp. NPDC057062]|uniref:HEAT repeat domain-containing protein n=1 Tax=Streptomyces sp. NPDC057062 TaxID=3346011 RepID=UPI00362E734E